MTRKSSPMHWHLEGTCFCQITIWQAKDVSKKFQLLGSDLHQQCFVFVMMQIMAFHMWSFCLMLRMTLQHEVANELVLFSMSQEITQNSHTERNTVILLRMWICWAQFLPLQNPAWLFLNCGSSLSQILFRWILLYTFIIMNIKVISLQ